MQDVHVLLPLVFDDNEGSNHDNDINHMQHDDTAIMLLTGVIRSRPNRLSSNLIQLMCVCLYITPLVPETSLP